MIVMFNDIIVLKIGGVIVEVCCIVGFGFGLVYIFICICDFFYFDVVFEVVRDVVCQYLLCFFMVVMMCFCKDKFDVEVYVGEGIFGDVIVLWFFGVMVKCFVLVIFLLLFLDFFVIVWWFFFGFDDFVLDFIGVFVDCCIIDLVVDKDLCKVFICCVVYLIEDDFDLCWVCIISWRVLVVVVLD